MYMYIYIYLFICRLGLQSDLTKLAMHSVHRLPLAGMVRLLLV